MCLGEEKAESGFIILPAASHYTSTHPATMPSISSDAIVLDGTLKYTDKGKGFMGRVTVARTGVAVHLKGVFQKGGSHHMGREEDGGRFALIAEKDNHFKFHGEVQWDQTVSQTVSGTPSPDVGVERTVRLSGDFSFTGNIRIEIHVPDVTNVAEKVTLKMPLLGENLLLVPHRTEPAQFAFVLVEKNKDISSIITVSVNSGPEQSRLLLYTADMTRAAETMPESIFFKVEPQIGLRGATIAIVIQVDGLQGKFD
jgi:hypothetical protein